MSGKLIEIYKFVSLMLENIFSGGVDINHQTKNLWISDPIFMAKKLDNFHTKLHIIKQELFHVQSK